MTIVDSPGSISFISKADVFSIFQTFVALVETQFSTKNFLRSYVPILEENTCLVTFNPSYNKRVLSLNVRVLTLLNRMESSSVRIDIFLEVVHILLLESFVPP